MEVMAQTIQSESHYFYLSVIAKHIFKISRTFFIYKSNNSRSTQGI